jgi:hypothetical protein
VTTPPSKGLVVELYLIYFGLAQSFVCFFPSIIALALFPNFSFLKKWLVCGRVTREAVFWMESGIPDPIVPNFG